MEMHSAESLRETHGIDVYERRGNLLTPWQVLSALFKARGKRDLHECNSAPTGG